MQIHKRLLSNAIKEARKDPELAHFTDDEIAKMIDGFFRAAHIFHEDEQSVKFPYLFTSVFDNEKPERKATILKMADQEIDKIIKTKGSASKKEIIQEIKNAGYKFKHIKPLD